MMQAEKPAEQYRAAEAELAELCAGLVDEQFARGCTWTDPETLIGAARDLLVHRQHMTLALQRYWGAPVNLRVLLQRWLGTTYARKIVLSRSGPGEPPVIVELGLVKMDLSRVPPAAQAEILAEKAPLGDILKRHNVLTVVEPQWFLRLSSESPLLRYFEQEAVREAYGRVGVIHCNGHPAIRLLEIVPGTAEAQT